MKEGINFSETENWKVSDLLQNRYIKIGVGIAGSLIVIVVAGEIMKILAHTINNFRELKDSINR